MFTQYEIVNLKLIYKPTKKYTLKDMKQFNQLEKQGLLDKVMTKIVQSHNYQEIITMLDSIKADYDEDMWEYVGDNMPLWLEEEQSDGKSSYSNNIFDTISLMDYRMKIFGFAGECALHKKLLVQLGLANIYSDQSGLDRKFTLYEELVAVSYPLIKNNCETDIMHYIYTRALNRLADLTQYWCIEEAAAELWLRLANHALVSEGNEKTATLKIIQHNAPWFVERNGELFVSLDNK